MTLWLAREVCRRACAQPRQSNESNMAARECDAVWYAWKMISLTVPWCREFCVRASRVSVSVFWWYFCGDRDGPGHGTALAKRLQFAPEFGECIVVDFRRAETTTNCCLQYFATEHRADRVRLFCRYRFSVNFVSLRSGTAVSAEARLSLFVQTGLSFDKKHSSNLWMFLNAFPGSRSFVLFTFLSMTVFCKFCFSSELLSQFFCQRFYFMNSFFVYYLYFGRDEMSKFKILKCKQTKRFMSTKKHEENCLCCF